MALDEVKVVIRADASPLERELRKAAATTQQQANVMSAAVGGLKSQFLALVPAVSAVALVSFGRRAIEAAGHTQDLADRIGFAASTLSALQIPLATSGSSLDEFAASVNRMNNMVGEAAKGINQEAVRAFDQLGLSVRKLQTMTPEEQFYEVTQAIMGLGSQAAITEAGMNIFGRSFSAMQPLLKEHNGNMREAIAAQEGFAAKLDDETIRRVDEFGDSMEAAGYKAANAFIIALDSLTRLVDALPNAYTDMERLGESIGGWVREATGMGPKATGNAPWDDWAEKSKAGGFVTEATIVKPGGTSKGSNAGLLKPSDEAKKLQTARKAYEGYIKAIEDENYLLHINEAEREGVRAAMEAQTLAAKANISVSEQDREKIIGMTNANVKLKESMQEAARFSRELHDKLSGGLADIVLSFDSATDSARRFAEQIARTILERKVTGPLADSIIGAIDGGEEGGGFLGGIGDFFGDLLGFADGGRPPVGKPSIVGERGPEIFVPDGPGTVVPNHALGGTSVTVVQNNSFGSGVTRAEVANMLPALAAATKQAVFEDIQRGGRSAQIVGRRN